MSTVPSTQLEPALRALKTYEPGSSRGDLLPIDEAVRASLNDPNLRDVLEDQLRAALDDASILGQVYLLKKLAWVAGARTVGRLVACLSHPELADPACSTLAALPCPEAAAALRERLPQLTGNARLGAIHVLGGKRDEASLLLLAELLSNGDIETAGAAAGALGRIGSPDAGRVLADYAPRTPEALRRTFLHAVRECADRLAQAGQAEAANALLKSLD